MISACWLRDLGGTPNCGDQWLWSDLPFHQKCGRANLLYTYVLFLWPKDRPEASLLRCLGTAGIGASWPLSASSRFSAAGAMPAFFGHRCSSYVDTKLWRGMQRIQQTARFILDGFQEGECS